MTFLPFFCALPLSLARSGKLPGLLPRGHGGVCGTPLPAAHHRPRDPQGERPTHRSFWLFVPDGGQSTLLSMVDQMRGAVSLLFFCFACGLSWQHLGYSFFALIFCGRVPFTRHTRPTLYFFPPGEAKPVQDRDSGRRQRGSVQRGAAIFLLKEVHRSLRCPLAVLRAFVPLFAIARRLKRFPL